MMNAMVNVSTPCLVSFHHRVVPRHHVEVKLLLIQRYFAAALFSNDSFESSPEMNTASSISTGLLVLKKPAETHHRHPG